MTMTEYKRQKNADLLVAQHADVQAAAKAIRQTLHDVENYLHWSMDPDEKDGLAPTICQNLLDHAHQLVDEAHAYRQALRSQPPERRRMTNARFPR